MYNYIVSNRAPTVTLPPATTSIGAKPAPFMASFSSKGPNNVEPNILKPDITAPGLNILAAWTEAFSPLKYNIISGTSMSCPHVSAVAALLKAIHPNWSSAAIRSAIMTTAKQTNNLGKPITDALLNPATPFEYGSGHIQPSRAADPGLVYDACYNDYLLFLCGSIRKSLDPSFPCPTVAPPPSALNYPSLSIANLRGTMTVTRNVTNVGAATSSYSVTINEPSGFSVRISPTRLNFNAVGQTLSFGITVQAQSTARTNAFVFGSYTWSDGIHQVRSPIALSAA
ncbi:Tripeptidyl-peptidase II [Handroanthus impetiginosus]|uniref:Tripeptidyl-peptidase II n=1 Tax=Handroanthus impetiginosus TaxID=429701 RepID=A0A2G9HYI9_9LAMI|nr:Tripeptidyl-peptidase II [Handroanthus impetiginosus]